MTTAMEVEPSDFTSWPQQATSLGKSGKKRGREQEEEEQKAKRQRRQLFQVTTQSTTAQYERGTKRRLEEAERQGERKKKTRTREQHQRQHHTSWASEPIQTETAGLGHQRTSPHIHVSGRIVSPQPPAAGPQPAWSAYQGCLRRLRLTYPDDWTELVGNRERLARRLPLLQGDVFIHPAVVERYLNSLRPGASRDLPSSPTVTRSMQLCQAVYEELGTRRHSHAETHTRPSSMELSADIIIIII